MFSISKNISICFIINKIKTISGCVLCKYNCATNSLILFGNDEFLRLSDYFINIIENHYKIVQLQEKNVENVDNHAKIRVHHQTITLSKEIYDLTKNKFDALKKQYSIKLEVKAKKDNKIVVEYDFIVIYNLLY